MSVEIRDKRNDSQTSENFKSMGLKVQSIRALESSQASGYESSGLGHRQSKGKPALNQVSSQGRLMPIQKLSWIASNVRTIKEEREQKSQTATKLLEGRYEVAAPASSRNGKLAGNK